MIIRKVREATEGFRFLVAGDVFLGCNGNYYFKIGNIRCNCGGSAANAVNLETGEPVFINDDELITPVDCELLIK